MALPVRALALLVFAPAVALAADLGRLTALSSVGDPLRAEIEILAVQPSEGASLAARIPPPDVFWRANLEPPPLLDDLRARVERRAKGRYVVILSTTRPVENAFFQILVQLDTATGRVVREYPVLLDEPRGAPTSSGTATAAAPDAEPPGAAATGRTHVVKAGDTLYVVARAVRPAGATVEQTVVALYQANQAVFDDGNLHRLPVGAVLALPPDGAVTAIDPGAARRLILAHGTASPGSARRDGAAETSAARGPTSVDPSARVGRSQPVSGDQLHVARSPEGAGGALESARGDDVVALQRALAEVQERIALLQRELEGIRGTRAVTDDTRGSVDPPERLANLPVRSPGDAAAAERPSEGVIESVTFGSVAREHGGWLLATFLVGFGCWVVMPVKTARVWLKRRRDRERAVLRAALDTPARPVVRTLPRGNRRMAGRHPRDAPVLQ
jgi:pilus assembly protein FimV